MKKTILAALALLTLASCAKENSATELVDPNAPVAATFTSATITRVADNAWVAEDKIGITMVTYDTYTLVDSKYENVPYTVDENVTGTFTADGTVIYFPADDSTPVDFIAYYPYTAETIVGTNKEIAISVEKQDYKHIDLVAAKASSKTKESATVTFSGKEAFSHQLSKLSLTIKAGDGIDDLDGLVTTIKGQYTTANFNIYTFAISGEDNVKDMVTATTKYGLDGSDYSVAYTSAILIPTSAVDGSSIVFSLDGKEYIWDTSRIALSTGNEYSYTVTIKGIGLTVSGATINGWSDGLLGEDTEDIVLEAEPVSVPTVTQLKISNTSSLGDTVGTYSLTVDAENATKVYILELSEENTAITATEIKSGATQTIESSDFGETQECSWDGGYPLYIYAVAEDSEENLGEIATDNATAAVE